MGVPSRTDAQVCAPLVLWGRHVRTAPARVGRRVRSGADPTPWWAMIGHGLAWATSPDRRIGAGRARHHPRTGLWSAHAERADLRSSPLARSGGRARRVPCASHGGRGPSIGRGRRGSRPKRPLEGLARRREDGLLQRAPHGRGAGDRRWATRGLARRRSRSHRGDRPRFDGSPYDRPVVGARQLPIAAAGGRVRPHGPAARSPAFRQGLLAAIRYREHGPCDGRLPEGACPSGELSDRQSILRG